MLSIFTQPADKTEWVFYFSFLPSECCICLQDKPNVLCSDMALLFFCVYSFKLFNWKTQLNLPSATLHTSHTDSSVWELRHIHVWTNKQLHVSTHTFLFSSSLPFLQHLKNHKNWEIRPMAEETFQTQYAASGNNNRVMIMHLLDSSLPSQTTASLLEESHLFHNGVSYILVLPDAPQIQHNFSEIWYFLI